ncbi:FadR/GntR family transcriptional regulator [Notoacmeibacter sp. MSK16QG-6]|uniref:FadR/GntR family transcriptional regulator n=1 Tax=Notoacmeibacter sp. MSK16QG-6 TaxID=2957982 RepID=UPI0020A0E53E|nr:FadR/GntR family transcriptional regulator [Notoacmeibacter sp. MSK16QG-6]MCP1199559.1 FadR family transcriptional regulator [Notoacmeibacter sp. MSK16QG-6]
MARRTGSEQLEEIGLKIRKRQTLADQLYGQILEQIIANVLQEGEKLPSENQIAASFGVSRPVVREALRKLRDDGLVEARRGSGTFVRRRPPSRLIDFSTGQNLGSILRAIEARIAVESETARLAAQRAEPKDLALIEETLEDLASSMEARTPSVEADYAFHRAIALASGNNVLVDMLECARNLIENGIDVAQKLTREGAQIRVEQVAREHQHIFEAIRSRDAEAASMYMSFHLFQARHRITDHARIQ